MAKYFIQKVRKDDNDVIIKVKTMRNEFETIQVVRMINSRDEFFVINSQGPRVGVYAKKFIRSYRDNEWDNNLDELPLF